MKKNWVKYFKMVVFGLFTFGVITNIIVALSFNSLLYDDITEIPSKEVALVLGTSKNTKTGINPYFKYRMEAAAELYHHHKVKAILVSGDNHIEGYDETSDMENYLIELGVPKEAIIKDYAGFRTLDSVVRAKKVFNFNSLIIVSQEFHNKRAIFIAKNYGIDAVAYNAADTQRRTGSLHLRELLARPLMILDLFVLQRQPKFL